MIRLVVNGARGRMGARLCALALDDSRFELAGTIDREGVIDSADAIAEGAFDAIIDVSNDAGAQAALRRGEQAGAAVLIATTGLSDDSMIAIDRAAANIPVLSAANTSIGIAVVASACRLVARLLGDDYDVSLVEHHHAMKRDSPSGTALRLMDEINAIRGPEKKSEKIVGFRAGDVIGEHSVRFTGPGEYIEIIHRATTRDLFVRGALTVCAWLVKQPAGRYDIKQALGIDS